MVVVIEVLPEDRQKVFEVLLSNGKFRGFDKNKFDIIEHGEEVLKKLHDIGITPKILSTI